MKEPPPEKPSENQEGMEFDETLATEAGLAKTQAVSIPVSSKGLLGDDGSGVSDDSAEVSDDSSKVGGVSAEVSLQKDQGVMLEEASQGRYHVRREIGRGGMGRVFLVHDGRMGRDVALKMIGDAGATSSSQEQSKTAGLRRFLREVQLSGRLEHPSVVPVYDLGETKECLPYYTMRYIEGRSMWEALKECKSLRDRLALLPHFRDICNAMAFSHDRGIIHRDLKPSNVILGRFGETIVIDWGLAKTQGDTDDEDRRLAKELRHFQEAEGEETLCGTALGTPAYMSPEQARGEVEEVDHLSDVYSLGAILYEILTGSPPHTGSSPNVVMLRVVEEPIMPVRELEPYAPAELCAIAEKALQKDKGDRYPFSGEFARDLSAYLSGEKISIYQYSNWELFYRFVRRNRLLVSAILFVVLAIVGTTVFMARAWHRESRAVVAAERARRKEELAGRRALRAKEEERVQKELAQKTLKRKIEEERKAAFRLAETRLVRAEELFQRKHYLEAAVFAASAGVVHPGNPRSPSYHSGFCGDDFHCRGLTGRALGIYMMAQQSTRVVHERTISIDPPLVFELPTAERLHLSPNGRFLTVVSNEKKIRVWDLSTGALTHTFSEHSAPVSQAAFNAQGDRFVSVDSSGNWVFRQFPEGKIVHRMSSDMGDCFSLEPLPSTDQLIATLKDGRVMRIDSRTGDAAPMWPTKKFKLHGLRRSSSGEYIPVFGLMISPTGRFIAVFEVDGAVHIYNVKRRTWRRLPMKFPRPASCSFFGDDEYLIMPDIQTNSLMVFAAPDWKIIRRRRLIDDDEGTIIHFFSPYPDPDPDPDPVQGAQANGLLIAGVISGLQIFQGSKDRVLQGMEIMGSVTKGGIRSGGSFLTVLASSQKVLVLRPASQKSQVTTVDGIVGLIEPLPDGNVLVGSWNGSVRLIDRQKGTERSVGRQFDGFVWTVDMSPDRKILALGSRDDTLQIVDYPGGVMKKRIQLDAGVTWVRFSPDGKKLFAATFKSLHVLKTDDWSVIERHGITTTYSNGPSMGLSSKFLVYSEGRDELTLFSLKDMSKKKIRPEVPSAIMSMSRVVDPDILIVQDKEFCLNLIRLPATAPFTRLCGLNAPFSTASLSRDGKKLLVSGDDHTVRLWSLDDGVQWFVLPTVIGQVAAFDSGEEYIYFEHGNQVRKLRIDKDLIKMDAVELLKRAEEKAGACLDGAVLRPLQKCSK